MGLFRRREDRTPDEALPFLSVADAERVRRLAADALTRAGVPVVAFADRLESLDGRVFGLWNLAALCAETDDRRVWPDLVEGHVARLLQPPPDVATMPVDELLAGTVLRVYSSDTLAEWGAERLGYAVPVAEDLVEALVLDSPHAVSLLTDDEVARAGHDALRAAGHARLVAEPYEHRREPLADGAEADVLIGDSMFVASKVLVLDHVLTALHGPRAYPDGVLVALPDRHTLVLHVPDGPSVVPALQGLAGFAAGAFAESAGGVSPSVYWWRDGVLRRVSRRTEDGRTAIEVGPELEAVLSRNARA